MDFKDRFIVSEKPMFYSNDDLTTGIDYCIIDIRLGSTYPLSNPNKICKLLNEMEKEYQEQSFLIHSYGKIQIIIDEIIKTRS